MPAGLSTHEQSIFLTHDTSEHTSFVIPEIKGDMNMNFGFLVFPGVEELDLIGPWEMITLWNKYANGPDTCITISETSRIIECAKGIRLKPHATFSQCPRLDFLLVPGGEGTRKEVHNSRLMDFVAQKAGECRIVLSVCTGSFILQKAGLLEGKKATTHWASLDRLRKCGDVKVVEERIVRQGSVWTASGVSAGIDLALSLIQYIAGDEAAAIVQMKAEYFPSRTMYGDFKNYKEAPSYISGTDPDPEP